MTGGVLTIRTGTASEGVWISVGDTGQAFRRSSSRLFEPFFTTKKKGTGLGMMIVYRIVRSTAGASMSKAIRARAPCFASGFPCANEARDSSKRRRGRSETGSNRLESLTGETCCRQVEFPCCVERVRDSNERGAGEKGGQTRGHLIGRGGLDLSEAPEPGCRTPQSFVKQPCWPACPII